jgi:hypothetical protein
MAPDDSTHWQSRGLPPRRKGGLPVSVTVPGRAGPGPPWLARTCGNKIRADTDSDQAVLTRITWIRPVATPGGLCGTQAGTGPGPPAGSAAGRAERTRTPSPSLGDRPGPAGVITAGLNHRRVPEMQKYKRWQQERAISFAT